MGKLYAANEEQGKAHSFFGVFGIKPRLAYFGLCFTFCWFFSVQRLLPEGVDESIQGSFFVGVSASCLLCALVARRRRASHSSNAVLQVVLTAAMMACSLMLVLPNSLLEYSAVVIALGTLGGVCVGWQYMLWGSFYSKLDVKPAIAVLFGTVIAAAVMKTLVAFFRFNPACPIVFSCLPLASMVLWRRACRNVPAAHFTSQRYTARSLLSLKWTAVGVVVFSFAIGLLMAFDFCVFTLDVPYLVITHALTIAVCVPFIVIAYCRKEDFDFVNMWFAVLLAIAGGAIFTAYPVTGAQEMSFAIFTAAQMFVVAFLWLALADVSHNSAYASDATFGFGWLLYSVPTAWGLFFAQGFSRYFDRVLFCLVILFILIVVLYLFMRERQPYNLKLFQGLNPPLSTDRLALLGVQIDALANAYDLTDREKDVIVLYAQGRSRAFIGTRLFISENTVRDHLRNVYRKMRIHNKQELIDRIEQMA